MDVNDWTLNQRTLAMLARAQELYGGEQEITGYAITQGSYTDDESASFGTQAMGGVINLVPRPLPSGPTARAGSRFGSCGYQRVSAEAGTGSPDGGILLGIVDERSVDNYAFRVPRRPAG